MTNEELCILAQKGNTDAANELTLNLLPTLRALAVKYEAKYSGLHIDKDDLLQEGTIGFLRAVHYFYDRLFSEYTKTPEQIYIET